MEWVVLGSGTAVPHAQRGSAGYLLRGPAGAALFDSGSGTKDRLARSGTPFGALTHLVYTHAHLDHWADLLPFLFYRAVADPAERRPGLTIAGPPVFIQRVRDVAQRIDPSLLEENADVVWQEVRPGRGLDGGSFRVTAFSVEHGSQQAYAYRVQAPDGSWSLCYSGDTSPCEGIEQAARGVDWLVCECSFPDDLGRKNHMTPRAVRQVADRAAVQGVVLTHLYPEVLQTDLPGAAFADFGGQVLVATDGLRVELGAAGPPS